MQISLNTTIIILLLVFLSNKAFGQNSETIHIDSVSVNEDMHVAIGWTFESDVTDGYFVIHRRRKEEPQYDSIAATGNLSDRYFVDSKINASESPQSYYISAIVLKEDGTFQSFARSNAHQTIFIENISYDICQEKINIQWAEYTITTAIGTPDTLESPYDSTIVFTSLNNNDYIIADTVPIGHNYTTYPAMEAGKYCFKAMSFDTKNPLFTSTSNIKCKTTSTLDLPEFAYLRKASVIDNNYLQLNLYVDSTVSSQGYIIHRAVGQSEDFLPVDTVLSNLANITYIDNADFNRSSYRYYFETLDSCKRPVKLSDTISSIYLFGEAISINENQLQWNHPEGFPYGVDYYYVLRKNLNGNDFIIIDELPGYINNYNDYTPPVDAGYMTSDVVYKIKAVEASGNPYGFKDTVASNRAEILHDLEVFIPNAFKPSSTIEQNRVFKPIIRNVVPENFRLVVYNNWGQQVFYTDDSTDAWDGKINGNKAPAGAYLYNLTFESHNGKAYHKKGSVMLIR